MPRIGSSECVPNNEGGWGARQATFLPLSEWMGGLDYGVRAIQRGGIASCVFQPIKSSFHHFSNLLSRINLSSLLILIYYSI